MDTAEGKHPSAGSRRRGHLWFVPCASLAVGVGVYGTCVLVEQFSLGFDTTATKAIAIALPIPIVFWQAMAVSRRLKWLTGAVAALALFCVGRWLEGLFGLDPPYIHFFLGIILQVEAVAIAVAIAVAFTASSISRINRGR